jgi:hypothetical protein
VSADIDTDSVPTETQPCPSCTDPVEGRAVGGRDGLERGSCRRCGLQLVRHPDEGWREIRG